MAAFNKFNCFLLDLGLKKHDLSADEIKLALTNTVPVATNAVLSDLTEIAYTNLSTRVLTTTSWSQSSGTAKLILADLTLTASGGSVATFRYVAIYNNTHASKPLIGWYDRGSTITMIDGDSTTIDLDNTAGLLSGV